jgi:hypothetical protein
MNSTNRSVAVPVTFATTSCEAAVLALDELLGKGMRGSASALHAASYKLRARLILEVWPMLEEAGFEQDAEDIADDAILAVLEGRVRAPRGPGQALAAVLRHGRLLAEEHIEDTKERWGIDEDE